MKAINGGIRSVFFISAVLILSGPIAMAAGQDSANTEWKLVPGAVIPVSFQVEYKTTFLSSSDPGNVNIDWTGIHIKGKKDSFSIKLSSIQDLHIEQGGAPFELVHNWVVVDYKQGGKEHSLYVRHAEDKPRSPPPYQILFGMYYSWKYSTLPEPDKYEFSVANVEAYEASGLASSMSGYMGDNKKQLAMIEHIEPQLDAHLAHLTPNTEAGILKVRLLRNKMILSPTVFTDGKVKNGSAPVFYNHAQRMLDAILSEHPQSDKAHYWKARLYGMGEPQMRDGKLITQPHDLEQAISHSLKAVEIKPDKMLYREVAAAYYIEQGNWDPAGNIVSELDPEHPIPVLVADMQSFPMPAGTIELNEMSRGLAQVIQKRGLGYERIRARAYMVPLSIESLTTFYKGKWKRFRLFKDKERQDFYLQFIKLYGGKMKPSLTKSDLPKEQTVASKQIATLFGGLGTGKKKQGIMMMVVEGTNVDTEHRVSMQAPAQGDFCLVQLINQRTF